MRAVIVSALSLGLFGCGTLLNMGVGTCAVRDHPLIYGGVEADVEYFAISGFPLGLLFALYDLPFSLVADTLTLPWSVPSTLTYGGHDGKNPEHVKPALPRPVTDPELEKWQTRFIRNDELEQQLGMTFKVEGYAHNAKLGAMISDLWVDGLDRWSDDLANRKVRVTGVLIRRDDLPVFHPDPNEPVKAGIPVPGGVDLEKACRRYLIGHARWERLSD